MPFPRRSADKLHERSVSPTVEDSVDKLKGENYLRELTAPNNPDVDLVAVHGLNPGWSESHGEGTWTKNGVLWLKDKEFLPKRFPNARVLLFGYNAKVAFDTTIAGVMDVALVLLNRLRSKRRDDPERPIIFLCHSLGGIVVKQALIRASLGAAYESIRKSTKGIAFFGTPHRGGNHADLGSVLATIVTTITGNVKNNFMKALQKNSTIAQDIHELFKQQAQDYQIVSFYETKPFKNGVGLIVDKVSASLGLPDSIEIVLAITENHSDICKFDKQDDTYELVIENIADLVQRATKPPASLSVPAIFFQDAQTNEKRRSVASFRTDDSLSEGNAPLLQPNVHYGMPTYSNSDLPSGETSGRQSLETSVSSLSILPVIIMPYSENPDFIGRDKIFDSVKSILQSSTTGQKRVALYGLGGVGKSQIAIRYAYWYQRAFPDHSVFWIHSSTAERFQQALVEIGTECRVPNFNNPNTNRLSVLRDWLLRDASHPWLMILDNADDPDIFQDGGEGNSAGQHSPGLSQYIPDCEHGTILVTTRDLTAGRRLTKGNSPLLVGKMSPEESILILKNKLRDRSEQYSPVVNQPQGVDDDFERLAHSLGYLPLAMVQAASFIQENSMNVDTYLRLIEEDSLVIQLLKHDFEERGRDAEVPNSVYATWKLSIERIGKEHPKSAELLFVMAHYEQSKIPALLLKHVVGHSPIDFTTTVGVLMRFSLVGHGSGNSYNMHRLVQLTVKQWLTTLGSAQQWASKALGIVSEHFPSGEYETWTTCASLEPHAVKITQTVPISEDDMPHLAVLQKNLAWYYFTRGSWTSSEVFARASCRTFEKTYGLKNRDTLEAKSKLSHILKGKGSIREAEKIAKDVVDGTRSLLGSKDEQTFAAYDSFALIYQTGGKLALAEKACRRALSGREKTLGSDHPDVYRSQRRLATILELSGKYDAAETLITNALTGQRALAGPSDKQTLQITYRLAFIQRAQGKYAEAEQTVRENLATQISVFGINNMETRKAQYSLAVSLIAQSKLEEAETIIQDLREYMITEQPFDPGHPYSLYVQFQLGRIRTAQGRYEEAFNLHRTVLEGFERLHADHPETYEYRSAYAAALLKLDPVANLDESYSLQKDAQASLKKSLGADHPTTLLSSQRISEVLAERGESQKALRTAKKVHDRLVRILKSQHPDTIAAKVWVEELEARGKQNPDASGKSSRKEQRTSLPAEKKDKSTSIFGRWNRSSKSAISVADSKEELRNVDSGSESGDDVLDED